MKPEPKGSGFLAKLVQPPHSVNICPSPLPLSKKWERGFNHRFDFPSPKALGEGTKGRG